MSDWVKVAELTELSRRGKKLVVLGDERVALFHDDGEVFAFRDACVHKGRPLSRGTLLRGRLICPGHQWAFDLRTGRADDRDDHQPGFPVRVVDGGVWIRPGAPAAPPAPLTARTVQE
ncbi:Rieske (2Fe-2S) protein [Streptomyces radicis]|uniref:Rieske domain-containing protein n=1 Tax=Streptomyces radicis TaxID=1750517 RepID=A0A3A9WEA2_9ACTN|nr:Rieske 2Fe-2S domain-containing protein [Streptomyces radicis]RKN10962.1 hypothetical protein D7319_07450 [Streptomyces radicis]RKN25225.1 hypothetical protein D7318_08305 [Streptomyces radicis]